MTRIYISIVVCTYNRAEMLHGALKTLICQETDGKFSYDIVLLDNASTDNTKAVVEQIATNCPVSINYIYEEKKGVAQARNRGVKESQGEWIAFFDDDQLAERDWLKNLLAFALQAEADCVGGAVRLDLPQEQLARLGSVCRGVLGERTYHEKPVRCSGGVLPATGNLLMARGVFDSIGLFDASTLYGGEDSDVLARAQAAGFDIWIAPDAVVHHVIPPYRLERAYFRWVSLRGGCHLAQNDCKQLVRGKIPLLCMARIGQALLVNIPCLLLDYLKRDKAKILDRKCLLWKAEGYTRQCFRVISPRLFAQERYFAGLEFRKGRTSFSLLQSDVADLRDQNDEEPFTS